MRKIFTLLAATLMAANVGAQTGDTIRINMDSYDAANSTSTTTAFTSGFKINGARPAKSGTWKTGTAFEKFINFKNNTHNSLVIPDGTKVYRLEISGYSQGDNWEYLAAYGNGTQEINGQAIYEWVDAIGNGVKDNTTITTKATYPIDPCSGDATFLSTKTDPTIPFAVFDFSDAPISGSWPFYVTGNNQYDLAFKVYTSKEAADKAAFEATNKFYLDVDAYNDEATTAAGDGYQYFKDGFKMTGARINKSGVPPIGGTYDKGINFKNNSHNSIVIPEGKKAYRIEISGFSQGDNWEYLAAYGNGTQEMAGQTKYAWVDPIGNGVKDNETIAGKALYPMDPCSGNTDLFSNRTDPTVPFAILDFGDEPVSGEFPFYCTGNNQYDLMFTVYTSREEADKSTAKQAERPITNGISKVTTAKDESKGNGFTYNLAGQRVDNNYKGIVIRNGKKCINK